MKKLIVEGNICVAGVYGIYTKFRNGRREYLYIGSAKECNDARSRHQSMLRYERYAETNKEVLQKYWDSDMKLYVSVIEEVSNYDDRIEAENYYIEKYKDTICNGEDIAKARTTKTTEAETMKRRAANRGSKNPNAKLNESQVLEIRFRWNNEDISQMELSRMFGISYGAINNIINEKRWKIVG